MESSCADGLCPLFLFFIRQLLWSTVFKMYDMINGYVGTCTNIKKILNLLSVYLHGTYRYSGQLTE